MELTRRDWLAGYLALAPAIAAAQQHARHAMETAAPPKLSYFDPAAAADVAAIAAQILPSDGSPGATEAGVIFFIDQALQTFDSDKQAAYRSGLADLRRRSLAMFPGASSFASLQPEQQLQVLHAIEHDSFFELVRVHTLLGFLGTPAHGGNRNQVGWKHIAFEDRMNWEPPFGFYDAEAR